MNWFSPRRRGAFLYLTHPAHRHEINASRYLQDYVASNHDAWVEYAHEGLYTFPRGRFCFVRGWVKAPRWVTAAIGNASLQGHIRWLSEQTNPKELLEFGIHVNTPRRCHMAVKTGPSTRRREEDIKDLPAVPPIRDVISHQSKKVCHNFRYFTLPPL